MQGRSGKLIYTIFFTIVSAWSASLVWAQSLSTYGTPGLVELPTAEGLSDGELGFSASTFGPNFRYTTTFQVLPRVYGSFRYSAIKGFFPRTYLLPSEYGELKAQSLKKTRKPQFFICKPEASC
jgi:hypothetical protein